MSQKTQAMLAVLVLTLGGVAVISASTAGAPSTPAVSVFPDAVRLSSADDRQSLVVRVTREDGVTLDETAAARIEPADPNLLNLNGATVRPAGEGRTQLRVRFAGQEVVVPVTVERSDTSQPISFRNDVVAALTKAGCNTGACHGSARGQDGFHLSLFGYDPASDYRSITRELPGRRINVALPHESLLLEKAVGAVPHTGGKLFDRDSELYEIIHRWIAAGAPDDPSDLPRVTGVEVMPEYLVLEGPGDEHRLTARATYSDGSDRDVTSLAVFMSNNDNSATVSPVGLIEAKQRGEAFVMARFDTFTVGTHVVVVPRGESFEFPRVEPHNYIDEHVHAKLRKLRMAPSELCSDEVFLRRVYLDIVGQLPPRDAYEAFLSDDAPDKRAKLVDELLGRKAFVEIWVMKWAERLQIRSSNDVSYKAMLRYYSWLQDRIANNVPMNEVVRELLAASGGTFTEPATNFYQIERDTLKLSENVAQVFVGARMQCAQCHNHPFDRWTMDDYYGFAAFFAQVGRKRAEDPRETIIFNRNGGEVTHPVGGATVPPTFLGGEPADVRGKDRRAALAQWLTARDNPYFAKNMANFVWQHFFGRGIVEPYDDFRVSNPPSNPQLLDALADKLVAYDYDFRRLIRDICLSRTYQLSTRTNATNASDESNFSHAAVRRLRSEVMLDCISQVTRTDDKFKGLPQGARAVQIADGNVSTYFLTTFGRAPRETVDSCEVSTEPDLSQALHLINGDTVHRKIRQGGVVKALLDAGWSDAQVIEDLYIRTLTRKPTERELAALTPVVAETNDRRAALEDVFWALLNSKEFVFNH